MPDDSGRSTTHARGPLHPVRRAVVVVGILIALAVGAGLAVRAVVDRVRFGSATALHRAILLGDADRARALIADGADINAVARGALSPSMWGVTPLHVAASANDRPLVETLIERGAALELVDECGYTPLHAALRDGADDAAQALIAANESVRATDAARAARCGLEVPFTPLQTALQSASRATLEAMLAAGADVPADAGPDAMGLLDGRDFRAKLELLLERRAEWGVHVNGRSAAGTALHTAAVHDDVAAIDLLLDHGAAIEDRGATYGFTPLLVAASVGANNAIVRLLDRGADPAASSPSFGSVLYVAAFSGERETVRRLLELRQSGRIPLDLHAGRDSDGATPLHMAYFHHDAEMVQLLLTAGANAQARTTDGRLPEQYGR